MRIMKTQLYTAVACAILALNSTAEACTKERNCILISRMDDQKCELEKTSLSRCSVLPDYLMADKELNFRYRALVKKLDQKSIASLRSTQREWIKFREEKCIEFEIAAECDNGICAGVNHDNCVVDLTKTRTEELKSITIKLESAPVLDFGFDKIYPRPSAY